MKKKLLALLSLFLALVVFVSPFSCCLDKVSAASSINYSIDYSGSVSYVSSSSVPFNINYSMSGNKILCIAFSQGGYNFTVYFTDYYFSSNSDVTFKITYVNNQLSVNYVDANNNSLYSSYYQFRNGNFYSSMSHVQGFSYGNVTNIDTVYANSDFISDPVYKPSFEGLLVGFPVAFQFNEQDFYNWIINNNKLAELPSYITQSKLLSFLSFYKSFGSSNTSFVTRIVSWFAHMNIANQSNENIVILKQSIDKLYQEYINQYKHEFYSNSANQAHHRRNIQTQTDDDDLTLVTDDQSDDIYTKLLREIIRGIIALQVTVSEGHRAIIDTLNNLDFTVAVSNNGGDFQFPDLEDLFTPTYSGFDDLEDQFFEKFPFLLDLQDLPEIEDYLEAEEQGDNLQVAALSAGSESVEADPLKSRDDLFRFTVPADNNFMNGAVSGMSIDFASFTKFAPAIEALKGIISVIALFGFSHWLIKFAPKLLHGYASSD